MTIKEIENSNPETNSNLERVNNGFQDISGSFPRINYINNSDVNLRSQGELFEEFIFGSFAKASPESTKSNIQEPISENKKIAIESRYPYNHVLETPGGHIIERDDTPGHERLNVQHKTGSKIEIMPDGTTKFISKGDSYVAIAGENDLIVRGNVTIIVESNTNIRVKGDLITEVDGDWNVLVHGDHNVEVIGNSNQRYHSDATKTITGNYLRDTRGIVTERNLSDYLCWNKGKQQVYVGGLIQINSEQSIEIVSDEEFTIEGEGGSITLNGEESTINAHTTYFNTSHLESNLFAQEAHVTTGYASTWHGELEGNAKKATYANTAGAAPTGSAAPTTPSPTAPTASDNRPIGELEAYEVVSQSDPFIKAIDRSTLNGDFNKRKLSTYEVVSRLRNQNLRYNSTWLQDQVNTGAILPSVNSSSPSRSKRSYKNSSSDTGSALSIIGNTFKTGNTFKQKKPKRLLIKDIPELYRLDEENLNRGTYLSPNFRLSQMLAGDSNKGQLIEQFGLSKINIAKNCQLFSFNILEKLQERYQYTWTISEGIYNVLPNEVLHPDSLNVNMAAGLGVGIQFLGKPKSFYFDAAVWMAKNLVYDKIVLSYIDYEPTTYGVPRNEPTIIIIINTEVNQKVLSTEWNHSQVALQLQDLS